MFEIKYLKLNYIDKKISPTVYSFEQINYIYGENNVGKTVMLKSIDFILGKSDFLLEKTDGLDGISSIEAKLNNDEQELLLFRSKDNDYGYKLSESDKEYLIINFDTYKKEITGFINSGNNKYFEEFKDYLEEDLTFRAFSFVNFLDEKGLGNLINIFTRVDSKYYNQKRAGKLMMFIFNYNNVSQLISLMREEKRLKNELAELNTQKETYNFLLQKIMQELKVLQLPVKGNLSLDDMYNSFIQFRNSFNRNAPTDNREDLSVLMKISYRLAEEIKYQENLEKQAQFVIDRNIKTEQLLNAFKTLISVDEKYSSYVEEIEKVLKKQKLSYSVLSVKDYKKTIEALKTQKSKVDKQIMECQQGLSKVSYWDTIKSIGKLEQDFLDIHQIPDMKEIEQKDKRLSEVITEIKEIKQKYDSSLNRQFNKRILALYAQLKKDIRFVQEDFDQDYFSIRFDPLKIMITGQKAKSNNSEEIVGYNPGSMARETTWQVLAYLVMMQILQEKFKELPVMKTLFIDGLNQPYDETQENYPKVCELIKKTAKEIGIQLFIVSTKDCDVFEKGEKIYLTGFNKAHRKQ